jgi:hypothetical protein
MPSIFSKLLIFTIIISSFLNLGISNIETEAADGYEKVIQWEVREVSTNRKVNFLIEGKDYVLNTKVFLPDSIPGGQLHYYYDALNSYGNGILGPNSKLRSEQSLLFNELHANNRFDYSDFTTRLAQKEITVYIDNYYSYAEHIVLDILPANSQEYVLKRNTAGNPEVNYYNDFVTGSISPRSEFSFMPVYDVPIPEKCDVQVTNKNTNIIVYSNEFPYSQSCKFEALEANIGIGSYEIKARLYNTSAGYTDVVYNIEQKLGVTLVDLFIPKITDFEGSQFTVLNDNKAYTKFNFYFTNDTLLDKVEIYAVNQNKYYSSSYIDYRTSCDRESCTNRNFFGDPVGKGQVVLPYNGENQFRLRLYYDQGKYVEKFVTLDLLPKQNILADKIDFTIFNNKITTFVSDSSNDTYEYIYDNSKWKKVRDVSITPDKSSSNYSTLIDQGYLNLFYVDKGLSKYHYSNDAKNWICNCNANIYTDGPFAVGNHLGTYNIFYIYGGRIFHKYYNANSSWIGER